MLSSELKQTLIDYIKAERRVFPLIGKVPPPHMVKWQETPKANFLEINKFKDYKSAAMIADRDMIIIDLDRHTNSADGVENFKKLQEKYSIKNSELIVKTPNSGYHLYYYLPKWAVGKKFKKNLAEYPGIDFKSGNGYVVMPNSELEDGRKYTYHKGKNNWDKVGLLPDKLVEALIRDEVSNTHIVDIKDFTDTDEDINLFVSYLQTHDEIQNGDRNNKLYTIACMGKNYGLSPQKNKEIILASEKINPPLDDHEFNITLNSAYRNSNDGLGSRAVSVAFTNQPIATSKALTPIEADKQKEEIAPWENSLIRQKNGNVSNTFMAQRNVEIFLKNISQLKGNIYKDLFCNDIFLAWENNPIRLDKNIILRIKSILNDEMFDPSKNDIRDAIVNLSNYKAFHPVRDMLKKLPKWDGKERLTRLLPDICCAADNKYTQTVGVKMLVMAISRVMQPGCKVECMPIFTGWQGQYKSTLAKTLALKDEWFLDNIGDISSKDAVMLMQGKWWVEVAELEGYTKKETESWKAFLSRQIDEVRLPYEAEKTIMPRQCVFFGTTNKDTFLKDETGSRRIWPIEVDGYIDQTALKESLEQLYAEALVRYHQGEKVYIDDPETLELARIAQDKHYQIDAWEFKIKTWLVKEQLSRTSVQDIWTDCLQRDIIYLDAKNQRRISIIMRHLKWRSEDIIINNETLRGFIK